MKKVCGSLPFRLILGILIGVALLHEVGQQQQQKGT